MSGLLRTVGAVPLREWWGVVASVAVAGAVEIGLRASDLPRVARLLGVPLWTGTGDDAHGPVVLSDRDRRRIRSTRRVMRHWPFGDTCLRQALVSGFRLRHLQPVLVVGVARIDGAIRAHAWLTIGGAILDPMKAAASYVPLTALDPKGAA